MSKKWDLHLFREFTEKENFLSIIYIILKHNVKISEEELFHSCDQKYIQKWRDSLYIDMRET